jgi:glycosyltransferase involved in cell wall biosynthesis
MAYFARLSMTAEIPARPLRIGIATDALHERIVDGEVRIANGGVGVYVYQLVSHLLSVDQFNEYYLIRVGEGLLDIYRHPRARSIFLSASKLNRAAALIGSAYSRPARELNLDLVHFPNMFGGGSLRAPAKQVATLQDLTPLILPSMHPTSRVIAYRMAMARTLRRSSRVIVPSSATGRDLIEKGFVPAKRIVRIPLGINPQMKRISPTLDFAVRYQISRPFILTVGVLEPRKNQMILLDVLRELRNEGLDLELIIIGRPGWRWTNPLTMEKYRVIRPWVRILADIPDRDLIEFYNRAELFIYPSFYEGFGLPILEAMACGAPVISSNASSMSEVAGAAALFADPSEAQAFASQALRLLRDGALRQVMVDAGVEHARKFSWRSNAEATLALYREVCGSTATDEHRRGLAR